LFSTRAADLAIEYLRTQLPPQTFETPLVDNATVASVRASKDLLPQMFEAANGPLEKSDYFLLAEVMQPSEIHPEVVQVLDSIAKLISDYEAANSV
jgi:hypothetical protein